MNLHRSWYAGGSTGVGLKRAGVWSGFLSPRERRQNTNGQAAGRVAGDG